MKKVILVFIICLSIIASMYLLSNNPRISNQIVNWISNAKDVLSDNLNEEYSKDFKINDLGISNNNYYFNTLNKQQQLIYTCIANGIKTLKKDINLKNYKFVDVDTASKDIEIVLKKFFLDHPEVYYISEKYTVATSTGVFETNVILNLNYSVANIDELEKQSKIISNEINKILSNIDLEKNNDLEKEEILHDIVAKEVKYYDYEEISQIPENCHNIIGGFIDKTAVCDGLSKTLQILLDKVGINSIIVTGDLNGQPHAWNMVELDKKWYNVDITSNKSIKSNSNIVVHPYFNITTLEIEKTHTIDEKDIIPVADKNDKNYYIIKNKIIKNTDDFNKKLSQIINENKNEMLVEYKVENNINVADKTVAALKKGKHNQYFDINSTKFVYYNILDTYTIIKK